ncbi:DUF4411 family protein [Methanobrevibacter sp.]|uniref:DUF4411 family protein n=1 Tax=Methanobrevibacter sp. TaxID=66852 RepID=UPI00386D18ED
MVYVIDTNYLIIAHDHYFPEVFVSFWDKIDELIEEGILVSINEVKEELKAKRIRDHWLDIDSRANGKFFKELINGEHECIPLIESLPLYKEEFGNGRTLENEWGNYATANADPWLIAYGWKHGAIVITNESVNKDHNIPHVCDELGVKHVTLKEFFVENNIHL